MMKNFFVKYRIELLVFIISIAVIHGSAFLIGDNYDHYSNPDILTYTGLAEFDFDQSPVRRYRVIIPWLAGALHYIMEPLFDRLSPNSFPGDFSMVMSFMLINTIFMGLWGLVLYRINSLYARKQSFYIPIMGVIAILSGRWVGFLTGTPMVDSLFLLMTAILIYGIIAKKYSWIILAIYIGPWAKESFIFFIPLLVFLKRSAYPKIILHLIISGIIVFSFRYWLDQQISTNMSESFSHQMDHFSSIKTSLSRLFSFHGIYELFSIAGFWWILIAMSLYHGYVRSMSLINKKHFWLLFILLVLFQALLSTELARMFLLLSPLLAILITIYFDRNELFTSLEK